MLQPVTQAQEKRARATCRAAPLTTSAPPQCRARWLTRRTRGLVVESEDCPQVATASAASLPAHDCSQRSSRRHQWWRQRHDLRTGVCTSHASRKPSRGYELMSLAPLWRTTNRQLLQRPRYLSKPRHGHDMRLKTRTCHDGVGAWYQLVMQPHYLQAPRVIKGETPSGFFRSSMPTIAAGLVRAEVKYSSGHVRYAGLAVCAWPAIWARLCTSASECKSLPPEDGSVVVHPLLL